jgi:hypothetical protein
MIDELTLEELTIILTEMVDFVKYKYDDDHIMKKFVAQLLKCRINKKWETKLNHITFNKDYSLDDISNYCENFNNIICENFNEYVCDDLEPEKLLQVNLEVLTKLNIDYTFINDINGCDKFEITSEITDKEKDSIQKIQNLVLNDFINHINSQDSIEIYKLISTMGLYKIDGRTYLYICGRFKNKNKKLC